MAGAFAGSLNVHAWASLDTFAEEIVDPVASRVFARSAFEYAHDPEPAAAGAAAFVVMVLQAAGFGAAAPCPPQDATRKPAAANGTAPSVMRPPVRRISARRCTAAASASTGALLNA